MTQRATWLHTFFIFLLHKVVTTVGSVYFVLQINPASTLYGSVKRALIDNYTRWDSFWYIKIAYLDYFEEQATAFFPLYPWTIRFLNEATGLSYRTCGLIVSNVSLFIALYFFIRLINKDFNRPVAIRSAILMVLFPTAFYFSTVYTESMFLMFTISSFYFARTKRFWVAGLLGGLASLTRNTGVLLALPFLYEYMASRKWSWKAIRFDIVAVGLIPFGLVVYMWHLWRMIGDPLAFVHAQRFWSRSFMWPWETLYQGYLDTYYTKKSQWGKINHSFDKIVLFLELFSTITAALFTWIKKVNIRWSYLLYATAAVVLPLSSPSIPYAYFLSVPRFVIVIFPLFVFWGMWIRRTWAFVLVALVSTIGMLFLIHQLTSGLFVY